MWICMNTGYYSIVRTPDVQPGHLLVRARRQGDIERLWPEAVVTRTPGRDYLYRAELPEARVGAVVAQAVLAIDYGNFKDSVRDRTLHDAYFNVWRAMAGIQNPPPYRRG